MSKPQHNTNYYRTLIRQFNELNAIPEAKRTGWQAQQLRCIKRSLDDYEERMALGEVRG